MYTVEELSSYLNSIKNEENSDIIEEYLNKIYSVSQKELDRKIKELGSSKEEIESNINEVIKFKLANRFKPLNDLISYGITNTTLHIHVIPKSVTDMIGKEGQEKANKGIIDALMKIRNGMLNDNEFNHIQEVVGISPLLRISKLQKNFKTLGFDVEEENGEMFKKMFPDAKKIMKVSISREKICSDEWKKMITNMHEDIDDSDRD